MQCNDRLCRDDEDLEKDNEEEKDMISYIERTWTLHYYLLYAEKQELLRIYIINNNIFYSVCLLSGNRRVNLTNVNSHLQIGLE